MKKGKGKKGKIASFWVIGFALPHLSQLCTQGGNKISKSGIEMRNIYLCVIHLNVQYV